MPRDFKSFSKQQNLHNQNKQNFSSNDQTKINEYENIINKYKDMNQNDLMSNLISEAMKQKKEGKLDSQTLYNLKSTLSPFLNLEQQKMLNELVDLINEQK